MATLSYRVFVVAMVLLVTVVGLFRSVEAPGIGHEMAAAQGVAQLVLTLDLLIRAAGAVILRAQGESASKALWRYLKSFYGLVDVLAALPFYFEGLLAAPADFDAVLGVARFLKLARYSPALETLGAVVRREARPLQSAIFLLVLLMLGSSTILYFVERSANPSFSSVPSAMWWSVATLTTVGYGDAVPISSLGKILGGVVALLGIGMFALPASILATGFSEELKRRDFLHTWHMVAKVPFLGGLDAGSIAAITALLKSWSVAPGEVIIRAGDIGDRMYFIVSGLVDVEFGGAMPVSLTDGDFFGEIALTCNSPRTATVTARRRCQLLILDAKDFQKFLANSPQIADVIAETAMRRLHEQEVANQD
ncbi:MAG TPA: cyclic nucleotide-gated ion channel [Telmatospirillum sp.]|nr:cyclic nucleotide-gated ion channel [Telmatospirillum sp.]